MTTSYLMNTYARLPISFSHGEGCYLFDSETNGKKYLDALAGIAVNTLGYKHPVLVKTISEQAAKILHTSNLFEIPLQEKLAEKLCQISNMQQVFFCNSGLEANEAAIKLALMYGNKNGKTGKKKIVVMEHSFHGRSIATLAATANAKVQKGFEPIVDFFIRIPFNDISAIQKLCESEHKDEIVAVMLEPLQGEGGIYLADSEYLQQLRKICDQQKWLLICDEVQCGMGRTGKWFAFQHANILPDVVTMAKGLASGVPIGACLASGNATNLFAPGNHGTTFGGNPLATSAALATISVIENDNLLNNAQQIGDFIKTELVKNLTNISGVVGVRGYGLMLGIELDRSCGEIVKLGLQKGLVINVTSDKIIRLLPPLIFSKDNATELVEKLTQLIKDFLQ